MAAEPYATVEDYRTDTGDASTPDKRVASTLAKQSAKLRALAGISPGRRLTDDQAALARELVCDAARKALVPATLDGVDLTGAKQGSFSANGFQASVTLQNPSGTAYFDRSTLAALRALLGTSQSVGTVAPCYGALG